MIAVEDSFARCYRVVAYWEGGTADHAEDPGGFTVKGITLGFLRTCGLDVNNDGVIDQRDLIGLTDVKIREIYRERIWEPAGCARMPEGLDLAVFDAATNLGQPTAMKLLQRAAGVKADGILGPVSWRAIKNADAGALLLEYGARRAFHYATRPKVVIFGLGWFRRLFDVTTTALDWA